MTEEKWLYWCDTVHDPYFNMSMDEVLLSNSALQENRVLVRIYRWDRPSVSFGSAQICPQELADKYTLVRAVPRSVRRSWQINIHSCGGRPAAEWFITMWI